MKTVYSRGSDVIHLFANLTPEERYTRHARASNVFFEGGVLYSYGRHFVLARYVEAKGGGTVVLASTRRYSSTTAKHQADVRGGMRQHRVLYVPDAGGSAGENASAWSYRAKEAGEALAKARKPEKYARTLEQIEADAKAYFAVVGGKVPKELLVLCSVRSKAEYAEALKKRTAQINRENAAKIKRQQAEAAKSIAEFRSFDRRTVHDDSGLSYLRYNPRTGRVETSQAVEIPRTAAEQLWRMIEYGRLYGGYEALKGFEVLGRYKVREFNDEFIEIGCHRIMLSEVDAIAEQCGWEMPPAEVREAA
jgi:hypothetical protein